MDYDSPPRQEEKEDSYDEIAMETETTDNPQPFEITETEHSLLTKEATSTSSALPEQHDQSSSQFSKATPLSLDETAQL